MRASTTNRVGPKTRATRRPPGRAHSHRKWTDRRGPVNYANGVTETNSYRADDALTEIADTTSTGTLSDTTYGRNNNDELTSATGSGSTPETTQSYGFDTLDRFDSFTSGGTTTTPNYDDAGNATTLSDGTTQTFDNADELEAGTTPSSHTIDYTYNDRGDLTEADDTTASTSQTYGYDAANRLDTYSDGTTDTTYQYNADDLRTSKDVGGTTTHFTWDMVTGGLPLLLDAGGTSYIYGPNDTPIEQIDSDGTTTTYLQHDQHGSTTLLTDNSGTVAGSYTYSPEGATTSHTGASSSLRYEGQYQDDESGLYYLQARYYDPTNAQFLTRDPLEDETGQPYAYAGDDPLDESDPTGLSVWGDIQSGVEETAGVVTGYDIAKSFSGCLGSNSAYDCAVMNFDPAYTAIEGYTSEWDAASAGCSLGTVARDGAEGVLGVAGTAGIAVGGAAAVDDLLGPNAALDTTPAGRPFTAHYLNDTGPMRNIPGSVVDEAIDHGQVAQHLADRTIYYDPNNDVTVVVSKTTGKIMSARRGTP